MLGCQFHNELKQLMCLCPHATESAGGGRDVIDFFKFDFLKFFFSFFFLSQVRGDKFGSYTSPNFLMRLIQKGSAKHITM